MTMQTLRIITHPVISVLVLATAGCNTLADIQHGTLRGELSCSTMADCVAFVEVPECREARGCEKSRCVFQDALEGTALPMQTPGDCTEMQCDGAGRTKAALALADTPDDGNPCTLDACNGSEPVHLFQTELPCYSGPPGTENNGICHGGTQLCDALGNPIGGCEGEELPKAENCISPLDDDCDGQFNEEGATCACKPGEIVPCYTGPAATQGVGACRDGAKGCKADGLGYGPCIGEQKPAVEMCDAAMTDEDCNGLANEVGANCTCGDGYVSSGLGEACDDGNANSDDACNASCQLSGCGDGYLQPSLGETCDDGNLDPTDACTASCQLSVCGDGIVQKWESCDDGNTMDGDACPATCFRSIARLGLATWNMCVLLDDSRSKCWGANNFGQLGLGDKIQRGDNPGEMGDQLPAVNLGTGKAAIAFAGSDWHMCALLGDHSMKCWGRNDLGKLGLGDTQDRGDGPNEMGDNLPPVNLGTGKTAVSVAAGANHTCALLDDGSLKCWGLNDHGQLGQGDTHIRGDGPNEMGDNLPPVDLGTGKTALTISVGGKHTCALLNDGSVKCWGNNSLGELGQGDTQGRGDQPNAMGDNLPAVNLGTGKTAIVLEVGGGHSCAILNDGSVKCWGTNAQGQLGLGDTLNRGGGPNQMGDNLPIVDLGTGKTAVAIVAAAHSCAILNDGSVKCWGKNDRGQLGLGDADNRGDGPNEMGNNLPPVDLGAGAMVDAIDAGAHTCALLAGGRIKCWGENIDGELGLGDPNNRGDNPGEMGGNLPFVAP